MMASVLVANSVVVCASRMSVVTGLVLMTRQRLWVLVVGLVTTRMSPRVMDVGMVWFMGVRFSGCGFHRVEGLLWVGV